jgi:CrcB protein
MSLAARPRRPIVSRMTWLLVALGGALGSLARHGLGAALAAWAPAGTLAANLAGCGLIGYLQARLGSEASRALLMTGFCGGFTTWSAFGLETVRLLGEGRLAAGAGYAGLTLALCLGAVALGWQLGR